MKILCIVTLTVFLTGCASSQPSAVAPFSIVFLNKPGNIGRLSNKHSGFDEELPGFHILGKGNGFVYARISPASQERPAALTLALQAASSVGNSTAEKPTLVALQNPINRTSLWMFSIKQGDTVVSNSLHREGKTVLISKGPTDYFRYDIVDDSIHVTFLPKAVALLSKECYLTWTHSLDR